jgi:phosphatidylglycerol lysyltransferase
MAVALGDPVGPMADAREAIAGFQAFCARNDWQVAFYQSEPDFVDIYREAGFDVLCIGHEAIVDLTTCTSIAATNPALRHAVHTLTEAGFRARMHRPPLDEAFLAELQVVSDEWLSMTHSREKRFSSGWFDEDYIRESAVMAVHAPDGAVTAFANLVTAYKRNEVSVDLVRHCPQVACGAVEFLFVNLFEWAQAQGYASFNLGLSTLSRVGEHPDDPAAERALRYVYEHVNQFYNAGGESHFSETFHPAWSPRYLVFSGYTSLPAVGFTLQSAGAGPDFLLDYAGDMLRRWRSRRANGLDSRSA